jgi:steroid 5-alpha reductase family enzyme
MEGNVQNWIVGILGSVGAILLALMVAWAGADQGIEYDGLSVFVWCGVFAFAVQWIIFIHAWLADTEAFFDLTGSLTYIVIVAAAALLAGSSDLRALTITGFIIIWALRLGPFLFFRIRNAGEDKRFRSIKASFPTFFMTWTLQGAWVYITASTALGSITSSNSVAIGSAYVAGTALWLFGFAIEVIADRQKTAFRSDPENASKFISSGLWAWSRHPNYFGEILLWVGIAVIAYPTLLGNQIFLMLSPLWVVFLLTAVSGVRMLEARGRKQWGEDPEYKAYMANTPMLVLWPPRK